MAEKHEKTPASKREKMFRQVVKLGSASSWTKFNLDTFQVDYERDSDPLPPEVYECAAKEKDQRFETGYT